MRFAFFFPLILIALAGCATDHWVRSEVARNDNSTVFLEHRVADGAVVSQGFKHPYAIDGSDLAAILGDLFYRESGFFGRKKRAPVFTNKEIDALAPALSRALAEAGPEERTAFVSRNFGGGVIFSTRRITRGVVFANGKNRLNIAFSRIDEELYPTDYTQMGRERRDREPTEITSDAQPLIFDRPWIKAHPVPGTGKPCPLWGEIDVDAARRWIAARVKKPAPEAKPPGAGAGTSPAATPEVEAERIKSKLKLLKDLYEEGLIDEKEYTQKKKELLEKI